MSFENVSRTLTVNLSSLNKVVPEVVNAYKINRAMFMVKNDTETEPRRKVTVKNNCNNIT